MLAVVPEKKESQSEEGLGRSQGGFSTKIHLICDALGMPLDFCITAGQTHDCTQAIELLKRFTYDYALMDKADDVNAIIEHIEANGAVAVIPTKKNRVIPREYDKHIYKERHQIECTFGWLKYFRRIFSRFEKTKKRFADFFAFSAAFSRMRYLNNA